MIYESFLWLGGALSPSSKMRRQLGPRHPLHEPDLQLFHQPGITEQVLRALHALQKFVQDFFRDGHSCFLSVKHEPDQSYTKDRALSPLDKPSSAVAEAVRNLRTSVLLSDLDNPPQIIMSSSFVPGEGKTTQSLALAQNLSGLRSLEAVNLRVAGLVLGQISARGIKRYGYGKSYGGYNSYYDN